jgi:DNA-binding GntR family transcriptional regulator
VTVPSAPPYVQRFSSLSELVSYDAETRFECTTESVVVLRVQLAQQLGVLPGSSWLYFGGPRYRHGDADPLCWQDTYLAEPLIKDRDAIRTAEGPFFERIRRLRGITAERVEQQIMAIGLSKDHAALLNESEGVPALLVRRRYFAEADTPFQITLSVHPGDRYVSSTNLTRQGQEQNKRGRK